MNDLTRQQLCAALSISESTVYRLEQVGLPYTPVGIRGKRYDLDECKRWLRANQAAMVPARGGVRVSGGGSAFTETCRKIRLRVTPKP